MYVEMSASGCPVAICCFAPVRFLRANSTALRPRPLFCCKSLVSIGAEAVVLCIVTAWYSLTMSHPYGQISFTCKLQPQQILQLYVWYCIGCTSKLIWHNMAFQDSNQQPVFYMVDFKRSVALQCQKHRPGTAPAVTK